MSISYDGGGDKSLLKLAAARVIATDRMPYLATALFAMVPVKTEGLGTFASDAKWRLYWDPAKVEEWTVEELSGVLLHEVGHCLRGHADRFRALQEPHALHHLYNVAGDALINGDLRDERIALPGQAVFIEHLENCTREMSTEQIYMILRDQAVGECTCDQDGDKSDEQNGDDEQDGSGNGQDGDKSDEQNGLGNGESADEQDGSGNGQPRQAGNGSAPSSDCPVHGGKGNGIPQGWDCGSAADGIARDYEQAGDAVDAGVDSDRADLIRQQVAVEITNHVRNRGTVPAGLERWAKNILGPVVDWRRELSSIVRRTFASVAGLRDYTYRRPSRRQAAMHGTGQNIILPAMRQPKPPTVAIVIDTSGSMSDDMLSWALTETQGVLRSLGSSDRSVRVVSCDAKVGSTQRVRNIADVKLAGGGGTDMRVGIEEAMSSHPKPDAVVLITDGFTPYPDEPLKDVALIVALTDEHAKDAVPEWARTVLVTRT